MLDCHLKTPSHIGYIDDPSGCVNVAKNGRSQSVIPKGGEIQGRGSALIEDGQSDLSCEMQGQKDEVPSSRE